MKHTLGMKRYDVPGWTTTPHEQRAQEQYGGKQESVGWEALSLIISQPRVVKGKLIIDYDKF